MAQLLIDDQGEIWDGHSRRLREAFDSPYSGGEFSDYAIANMGFVALNVFGSSAQVRLRPSFVGDKTHLALKQWLDKCNYERVVLSWLDETWSSELLRSKDRTIQRVEDMIAESRNAATTSFIARSVVPDELPLHSPVRQILEDWRSLQLPSGQAGLMQLLELAFGDRYIILKPDTELGLLRYDKVGDGLFSNYETWRNCAIGAPVEETPDRAMGRWAAFGYRNVLNSHRPRLEDVDAIVQWPHAGRGRLRYRRMIVPVPDQGGSLSLIGASLRDNAIDLRVRRG